MQGVVTGNAASAAHLCGHHRCRPRTQVQGLLGGPSVHNAEGDARVKGIAAAGGVNGLCRISSFFNEAPVNQGNIAFRPQCDAGQPNAH
ncbi:MAG: hypothetical protein FD159_2191 [Syntrophaceae bacterium]|nr:MAG: hypothetical protein FD159_2191 [Syntrophaceae bacterium]